MPLWFIDIESATEIEAKSNATPPAARTPAQASRANSPSSALHGVTRPSVEATPTNGLARSSSETPRARRNARCGARSRPSTVMREASFFIFGDDLRDARARPEAECLRSFREGRFRYAVDDRLDLRIGPKAHFALGAVLHRVPHLLRADADAGQKERPAMSVEANFRRMQQ